MESFITWDSYFMTMSYLVSMKSKDPRTRVGAIIVGKGREIISTGYNGMPRGYKDTEERYNDKNHKYMAVVHAEENAILHCARIGVTARSCSLYVPWIPCSRCAKMIIQVGIKEVIYDPYFPANKNKDSKWWETMNLTQAMFEETNVRMREVDGELHNIELLYQGQRMRLKERESLQ